MKKILVLLLLSLLFTGCTKGKNDSEATVLHDNLQLKQVQINSFDPIDAYHAGHIQVIKQIYNTLTDIDQQGKIIPSLASSWKTSDGKIWFFKLRTDVLFADDSSLKSKTKQLFEAKDVKYSLERLLHKNSKSLGASYFLNIIGVEEFRSGASENIKGIEVTDQHNIVFTLIRKNFNFPNILSLPYASIVKKQTIDFYGDDSHLHPVGTGPFKLAQYEPNNKIVLQKNVLYWEKFNGKQLPMIDGVTIHLTTDDNLAFLMFKNKKIDFLELNLPLKHQIENTHMSFKPIIESLAGSQLNFYLYNLEKIKNKEVRKAISHAINRNKLQELLQKQGIVADSLFPLSVFKAIGIPNSRLTFSSEKSKKLSGYKFSLKLVCFEDILSRTLAEQIAKELGKYSIDVNIEAVTFPVLVDRLTKEDYDLIQIYWGPMYSDVGHYLTPFKAASFPPTGNNFNKYSNTAFDKLIKEASLSPPDKQDELYLKAQEVILEDMPFLLLYYKNQLRATNNKFDMPLHPLGYRTYKYSRRNSH